MSASSHHSGTPHGESVGPVEDAQSRAADSLSVDSADAATHSEAYRPTSSLEILQQRARLIRRTREYFHAHGYWEVETPLLSRDTVVDLHLEPFAVQGDFGGAVGQATYYLQTSPEFHMKRLLAAGGDRLFQITRAFRQAERGQLHNPEFTILEWYARGVDHFQQMSFLEGLCRQLFAESSATCACPERFERLTYAEVFRQSVGIDPLDSDAREIAARMVALGIPMSSVTDFHAQNIHADVVDKDELLNLLLAERVEPWLAEQGGVFVYDYPLSQAALARRNPHDPRVAERFELYVQGVELCNGYHELLDAEELRERNREANRQRTARGLPSLPIESHLLAAMEQGLPPCSGVAVGLDRLLMLALGQQQLDSVWGFPIERA